MGLPMSQADGQIAGISNANQFAIATRNIKDFEHCGIESIKIRLSRLLVTFMRKNKKSISPSTPAHASPQTP